MAEKRSDVKKKRKRKAKGLRVIRPNVAGIDVGSKEHYVCCPPRSDEKRNVRALLSGIMALHIFLVGEPELERKGNPMRS